MSIPSQHLQWPASPICGKLLVFRVLKTHSPLLMGSVIPPPGQHWNVLFGTNGVITRTLAYWQEILRDLFRYIDERHAQTERLREDMLRGRTKSERPYSDAERAHSDAAEAQKGSAERESAMREKLAEALVR